MDRSDVFVFVIVVCLLASAAMLVIQLPEA